MKRFTKMTICLMLALIMLMSGVNFSIAGDDPLEFDGTQSKWAVPELQEAYDFGLTYPEIMKNFNAQITREEFCTIVVKLYESLTWKEAEPISPNPFTDTNNPEVLKAFKLEIVNGTSVDKFSPYASITRQDICVMIFRALEAAMPDMDKSAADMSNFTDAGKIANYAKAAVGFCIKNEIMGGTSPTTLDPLGNTSREQSVVLLRRSYIAYVDDIEREEQEEDTEPAPEPPEAHAAMIRDKIMLLTPVETSGGLGLSDSAKATLIGKIAGGEVSISDGGKAITGAEIIAIDPNRDRIRAEILEAAKQQDNTLSYAEMLAEIGLPVVTVTPNTPTTPAMGEGNVTDPSTSVNKGISFIGRGYDIAKGAYAVPDTNKGMKAPVLDVNKMVQYRQINRAEQIREDTFGEVIEKDAFDYMKTSTTSVNVSGNYMGFSGSVSTNFSSMNSTSKNRYLATQTIWKKLYEYSIADPIYFDYSSFLLESAEKALNDPNVTPATILDTYGTHVITSAYIGGRMDYNVSIESETSESFSSFEVNAKVSFNIGFAGGSGSYNIQQQINNMTFNSKTNRNVIFYGGNGTGLVLSPSTAIAGMDQWRLSVDNDPTFTDFGGTQLKPIWELCKDPDRSKKIKEEYDKRVGDNKTLYPVPKYVTGINFPSTKTPSNLPGYTSTSIDLNPQRGGENYLFYFMGEDVNYAYTDIFARYYLNGNMPMNERYADAALGPWKVTHNGNLANFAVRSSNMRWYDYNWDDFAEGDHSAVLVFATRDQTPGKSPIKRIEVVAYSSEPDWSRIGIDEPGWEYVKLLNEPTRGFDFRWNHKGDWVYIRFMRE
ncbi:MAG: MAC/perforin domain-containing protein [Oscillospiraceae bacterium]|nr:MAC/perforin domain-containing protein [Oscillospiraceae bacterium]